MNRNEKNKGITLIALVVTVVVLLILAGITISLIFGEDSIFETANKSKIDTIHAKVYDTIGTMSQDYYIKSQAGLATSSTLLDYLKSKQIIGENNVVNTEKLFGKKETLGNGTLDTGDVYVIEKEETSDKTKYKLVYYEKNNETNKNLGYLPGDVTQGSGGSSEDESRDWAKYFTYDLNEETKTATLTGVKEEYRMASYYAHKENATYGIKDGNQYVTDVIIPQSVKLETSNGEYETYTIDRIEACFGGYLSGASDNPLQSYFTSFKLPNTIKYIDTYTFVIENEISINLGNGLKEIASEAFSRCNFDHLEIPDSVEIIRSSSI